MSSVFENFAKEITKEVTRNNLLTSVKTLMETMHFTAQQAMDALRVPVEDRDNVKSRIVFP